jgi:hypothetical protein
MEVDERRYDINMSEIINEPKLQKYEKSSYANESELEKLMNDSGTGS